MSIVVLCAIPFAVWGNTALETPAFDANPLDHVLRDFVSLNGLVDYKRLKDDRAALDAFVLSVGAIDPAVFAVWPESDRIAFLINAYNAITLQRIIDNYPIKRGSMVSALRFPENSIRQIDGVWNRLTTRVLGRAMTLDHIEHDILRKDFNEPRLHAALVCAAMGCPPLRAEAYTGARLDEQLDDQSRRFLGTPHRFRIDRDKKVVWLSPILKWYGSDFVGVYNTGSRRIPGRTPEVAAVLDYTSRYVSPADTDFIFTPGYRVEFLDYDWSLNEQP